MFKCLNVATDIGGAGVKRGLGANKLILRLITLVFVKQDPTSFFVCTALVTNIVVIKAILGNMMMMPIAHHIVIISR